MSFVDTIIQILRSHPDGMTPHQIRDIIKINHPEYYGTESHLRSVEKGYYKDIDHALLAKIYTVARSSAQILVDNSVKPIRLYLEPGESDEISDIEDSIEVENLEKLEAGIGTLYVLGTNLYTKSGQEIVKIGITTGDVNTRINQLYTTGVPFRFRVIKEFETNNYYELEQSLHKLLDPFRINRSREFFTEECLPFVEDVISIHKKILKIP